MLRRRQAQWRRLAAFSAGGAAFAYNRLRGVVKSRESGRVSMERSGTGSGRRVLVIEDSGDHAFTLKLLLEHYGFDVAVAGDGELGLRVARRWSPDFVLLDIGLPGIDGYAVARALRADPQTANIVIIAMSAFDPGTHLEREKTAGFSARFVKPVPTERLLGLLTAIG